MLFPESWSNVVAWFTMVTSSEGESMDLGGMDDATAIMPGDDSARLVNFHLKTSARPRAPGAPGLKKRPSR